jgi:hypothetical protein
MKELGKKENVLKNICTLLLASVLFCASLSALTNTAIGTSKLNSNPDTLSDKYGSAPASASSYVEILYENFTDGHMPPISDSGQPWELEQTNPSETWHIDNSIPQYPVLKPSATVHRAATTALQDEWLITPSLNFSKYTEILLTFYWYTCYYVTVYNNHRYLELNISVSTDGGVSWTNIWSFNDNISRFFHDWTWYNYFFSTNNNPIDLSKYAGENDVKIAFQYYSNHLEQADEQMISIDDITVLGNGTQNFKCNAGGPYQWWWPMQYDYIPAGVRFHGNVTYETLSLQWLWDFGDGNTSTVPNYPIHFYAEIGIFNITLTVTDNSTSPPLIAIDSTTVNLFLIKPPEIGITAQPISLGIKAVINNGGDYNASFVNWTMKISWGPLQIFGKTVGNGTCDNIVAGSSETIRSKLYFIGFGRIHLIISAYPENLPGIIKHYNGLKIGPLVLVLKETGIQ